MKKPQRVPPLTLLPDGEKVRQHADGTPLPVLIQSNGLRMIAACLGAIALAIQFTNYGPLISVLQRDLQIAPGQAALLSSLLWLGLIVACLPAGWCSDRYGSRPVLLSGPALLLVGGVLLPLLPTLPWILACRALIGLGAGASFVAGAGVVAGAEEHTALAQGCYGGCVQIGSGLGLLVTPMLSSRLGWQGAFLVWGLAGVPALIAWMFVRKGERSRRPVHHARRRREITAGLHSSAVWGLGAAHMGTFGVSSVLAAWISVYLVQQYHVSLSLAATFGALGLLTGALVRPLGGWLLSKKLLGAVALIRMGTMTTCLGVAVLALPVHLPALAALGMAAVAVGTTLPYAAVFDSAARLRTVNKGVAQGLVSMIAWQSLLWGPPLIGVLLQATEGFTLPFGALVLVSTIALSASFLVGPAVMWEKKRRSAGPVGAVGW